MVFSCVFPKQAQKFIIVALLWLFFFVHFCKNQLSPIYIYLILESRKPKLSALDSPYGQQRKPGRTRVWFSSTQIRVILYNYLPSLTV